MADDLVETLQMADPQALRAQAAQAEALQKTAPKNQESTQTTTQESTVSPKPETQQHWTEEQPKNQANPFQKPPHEVAQEEMKQKPWQKSGWDHVDFGEIENPTLRQKVEDRFNRLYGQVKHGERMWEEARGYTTGLEQRLEQLEAGQQEVTVQQQEANVQSLQEQAVKAFEANDYTKGSELLKEMALKSSELETQKKTGQDQEQATQKEPEYVPGYELQDPRAQVMIKDWQNTFDFAQDGHPMQALVIQQLSHNMINTPKDVPLQDVLMHTAKQAQEYLKQHPELVAKPAGAQTNTVSDRQSSETPPVVQQVLGGNATARPANTQGTPGERLSDIEKQTARRIFNKISLADAYAKYAKGKGV